MLKLRASGRGKGYSQARGLVESLLRMAFKGSWPAHLWSRVPGATEVRVVRHSLPVLAAGLPPVRLGFISDIHLGPTTPPRLVEEAFRHLRGANLDILALGGDYVFLEATAAKALELAEHVAGVPARVKVAVLGNHDLWDAHEVLEEYLTRAGVEVLVNRSVRLGFPLDDVALVGLDDPWTGIRDPEAAFSQGDGASVKIVICHAPEGIPLVRNRGTSLFVCGHTHGGLVALPWGPIVVPGRYGRRYFAGLHRVDGFALFVSRGVGGIEIPLRLFAPPDVAILDLTPKPA